MLWLEGNSDDFPLYPCIIYKEDQCRIVLNAKAPARYSGMYVHIVLHPVNIGLGPGQCACMYDYSICMYVCMYCLFVCM